MTSFVE